MNMNDVGCCINSKQFYLLGINHGPIKRGIISIPLSPKKSFLRILTISKMVPC